VIIVQTLLPAELKMIELGGVAIEVISNVSARIADELKGVPPRSGLKGVIGR
jgi:hypothetical protein